ncbi:MAG TPA: dephospho-CoA kinase [Bacteroidota bacterium]|nr:dephospho-CoA kinase [Bacteroidota bacterium]
MPRKPGILKIGVTGGIGSGKSEVCRIFESLGVPVIYADDVAKELGNYDAEVRALLRKLLGEKAYTSDGVLDRAWVASRIFSNSDLRKKMNDIVHPRVERAIAQKVNDLNRAGTRVVLVEAALIYEAGLDKTLDAVLVVDADEETRIARVAERDGVVREQVLNRIASQQDPATKVKAADYVIVNNGTKEDLRQKVAFFHSVFQILAENNT